MAANIESSEDFLFIEEMWLEAICTANRSVS
jgi:hypothetical protein